MALPTTTPSSWMRELDLPGQPFETGRDDYELYEEAGEFVLSVELPGFDVADIDVTWDDGMLNIAAEDEQRNQRRTYHRRFRFPNASTTRQSAPGTATASSRSGSRSHRGPRPGAWPSKSRAGPTAFLSRPTGMTV